MKIFLETVLTCSVFVSEFDKYDSVHVKKLKVYSKNALKDSNKCHIILPSGQRLTFYLMTTCTIQPPKQTFF